METPKPLTLDLDLAAVQDPAVRAALSAIAQFANNLTTQGLTTEGTVKARKVQSVDDLWSMDEDGLISGVQLGLNGEGKLRIWVLENQSIPANGSQTFTLAKSASRILGVIGYSQQNASSSHWQAMTVGGGTSACYFDNTTFVAQNKVKVYNGNFSSITKCNLIIFYVE